MKRFLSLILALLLLPAAGQAADTETTDGMQSFFSTLFAKADPVGGVALVAEGDNVIFALPYGRMGGGQDVTTDTVFKVASVTKLISAIGVLQLAEQKGIDLDAPLAGILREPVANPYFPDSPVTLRQVMSHTSSISESAAYAKAPRWASITKEDGYFNRTVPGAAYEYANLNGGILGAVIERLSGQSLNTYMTEHVFGPLGINAAYSAALLPDSSCLSATYNTNGDVYMSANNYLKNDANFDDTCDPAAHYRTSVGSLYISASGLLKLGMMLANEGEIDGVHILNAATVHEMELDQRVLPSSSVTGESPYGLNLYRFTAGDGTVWYGHQGRWEGMTADLFYEKGSRTVLLLILNGGKKVTGREINRHAESAIQFLTERLAPIVE